MALLLVAIILNPWTVEQLFATNKDLKTSHLIDVILFDMFFIFAGLCVLFIGPIMAAISKYRMLQNIMMAIVTVVLVIFVIEFIFFFLLILKEENPDRPPSTFYSNLSEDFLKYDYSLGTKGRSGQSVNVMRITNKDNVVIYNVTYTLDKFGRRKTEEKPGQEPLIVFGGSYVFGTGLNNNETLTHFLSEYTDFSVYNYGLGGYGTQQMLANLEREDFISKVPIKNGAAIYVFIGGHVKRVVGSMDRYNRWVYDYPYYYLDENDQIKRKGSFYSGRPILSATYRVLRLSSFLKYFNIDFPIKTDRGIYLTYKIIEGSKALYQSKFDGEFYVIIHPISCNSTISDDLEALLKNNGINVLRYCIKDYQKYRIPGDGHPNTEVNRILAEMISGDINI